MRTTSSRCLAALTVIAFGIAACAANQTLDLETPLGGLEYTYSPPKPPAQPSGKFDIETTLPGTEGTVCITFKDEDGNVTGGGEYGNPSECNEVPDGSAEMNGGPCEQEESAGLTAGGPKNTFGLRFKDYTFWRQPVGANTPVPGISYAFIVKASLVSDAERIRNEAAAAALNGFSAPRPTGVEILQMTRFELVGSTVLLTIADDDRLDRVRIDLNGQIAYLDLADAIINTSHGGWHLATFAIDQSELNMGIVPGVTYSNDWKAFVTGPDGTNEFSGRWDFTL